MASFLISTLGMFDQRAYYLFIILLAVGFFGIYIPWNERKKGKEEQGGPKEKAGGKEKKPAPPMDRGLAVVVLVLCMPLAVLGLTMFIACAVMGESLLMAVGLVLTVVSMAGMAKAGRDFHAAPRRKSPPPPKAPPEPRKAPGEADRARLEQLRTLKEAGLLTEEEYREKRKELLEGKR